MTDKLKKLMERAEHWPQEAQEEAIASLEAIEEDFVVDAALAHELAHSRAEMSKGHGKEQEQVFKELGL